MYEYTITKTASDSEVEGLVQEFRSRYSSWGRIYWVTDGEYRIEYDKEGDSEGSFDWETNFTHAHVVKAFATTVEAGAVGLCCFESMMDDGLNYGCSQDADTVLQMMLFGELVYG